MNIVQTVLEKKNRRRGHEIRKQLEKAKDAENDKFDFPRYV